MYYIIYAYAILWYLFYRTKNKNLSLRGSWEKIGAKIYFWGWIELARRMQLRFPQWNCFMVWLRTTRTINEYYFTINKIQCIHRYYIYYILFFYRIDCISLKIFLNSHLDFTCKYCKIVNFYKTKMTNRRLLSLRKKTKTIELFRNKVIRVHVYL